MKLYQRFDFIATILLLTLVVFPATGTAQESQGSMIDRYRLSLEVDPDNPTLHYFLGIALIREGDTKEGLKELRIAYPTYTDSIEMQYNMGLAFSKLGDPDSAMLYLEQAETLGALDSPEVFPLVNAYYNVGLMYLENDNLVEAEKIFQRVLTLDKERVEVYRLLGDIAARSGRETEARDYITKYLEHYPDDQSARDYLYALYFNQALKQLGNNDQTRARQSFLKAYELSPDSPLVLYYLGSLDYNNGDLEAAVSRLRLAYPTAPEELRNSTQAMLYNCALQQTQAKQWNQALKAIEPLVDQPAARTKDLLMAGSIYLQKEDFSSAREIYLKVLAQDPANANATVNLARAENGAVDSLFEAGRAHFLRGEYQSALEKFDIVLRIRPDDHRSLAYRDKTLQRMTSDASTAFNAAQKAMQRKDYLAAVTQANRGLAMQPENAEGKTLRQEALKELEKEIRQLLENGASLLERNDFNGAEAQFRKVIQLDPDNTSATTGLAKISQQKKRGALAAVAAGNNALDEGNLNEAGSAFRKALALAPGLTEAIDGLDRLDSLVNSMIAQEVQWGRRARSAGHLDQAKTHFRNALDLKDSAEIRRELAAIDQARDSKIDSLLSAARQARNKKDYPKARSLYRRILEFDPKHTARMELDALEAEAASSIAVYLNDARRNMLNGKYQSALSDYRQALDLDPANQEALAGLDKGRNMLKSSIDTLVKSGQQAMDKGDYTVAESNFKNVLDLDPYNAQAQASLQRLEQIRLTGAKSGDEEQLYLRGIELYTKGKYAEAVDTWKKVLVLAPNHDKARMNIEKAERKLQKIKEFQGG